MLDVSGKLPLFEETNAISEDMVVSEFILSSMRVGFFSVIDIDGFVTRKGCFISPNLSLISRACFPFV